MAAHAHVRGLSCIAGLRGTARSIELAMKSPMGTWSLWLASVRREPGWHAVLPLARCEAGKVAKGAVQAAHRAEVDRLGLWQNPAAQLRFHRMVAMRT